MRTLRALAATLAGLTLLGAAALQLRAEPILGAIDIDPIVEGNVQGLAFDPQLNVFYLADGPFIDTVDDQGNLLDKYDFQSAYAPGSFLDSLSYDLTSGHLIRTAVFSVWVLSVRRR